MSNPEEKNVGLEGKLADSLLQVNKLLYRMPPEIGIFSERKIVTDFFQQSSYNNGETMVLDAQTGSVFVDARKSYLRLTVSVGGDPNFNGDFGSGSAVNMFNRMVLRSRSGKELSRVEDANLLTKYIQRYTCSKDWFNTVGSSQGYPDPGQDGAGLNSLLSKGDGKSFSTGTVTIFVIPMSIIPFYNQDKLIPPQIQEGMRLEITLESPAVAFKSTGVAVTSYVVSRPEVHWDTYDLADQFKRKITDMASSSGLVLLHKEYFHTITSSNTSTFNFDIKKAATKGLLSLIVARDPNTLVAASDSMASQAYSYTSQQAHIGSTYFPNSPLNTPVVTQAGYNESYYNTLYAMNKLECWNAPAVSSYTYGSTLPVAYNGYAADAMVACTLNKNQVSDMAGYVINNSRSLIWDIEFNIASSRRLDVWLCFLRAVKIFQSNCEVRD